MKVDFSRSGGFAPSMIGCELDTDSMAPDDAGELRRLVQSSGILQLQSSKTPGARDVQYYKLRIEDADWTKNIVFDQISLPQDLRPLISFLELRSRNLMDEN